MVDIGLPIRECRHQDQPREPFWMRRGVDDGRRTAVTMPDQEHPLGARGIGDRRHDPRRVHRSSGSCPPRRRARRRVDPSRSGGNARQGDAGTRRRSGRTTACRDATAGLGERTRRRARRRSPGRRSSIPAVGVLSPWPHMTPPVALCRLLTQVTSTIPGRGIRQPCNSFLAAVGGSTPSRVPLRLAACIGPIGLT